MTRRILIAVLFAAPLFAAYTYYYSDPLTSINTSKWTQNGALSPGGSGITTSDSNGRSLISTVAGPDGSADYEVRTKLNLSASGGYYISYLRASANALLATGNTGSYYAVEIANPTFSGSSCSVALQIVKSVSGSVTYLSGITVPCHNGMVVRSVITSFQMIVYIDGVLYAYAQDWSITSGRPGVGVAAAPSANTISQVDLGPLDRIRAAAHQSAVDRYSAVPESRRHTVGGHHR